MRILIINPFGIGDVLFTTPLIANLKEIFSDSYIGYVCNARTKDVLLNNPKVDKVFIYEKDKFRKLWNTSKILCVRKVFKLVNSVKKKKFDIAFDLSLGQEYGFFLWLAGIKKRVGYDYRKRGIFLTDKICISGYNKKHIAEYYLELLKLIGKDPKQRDLEFPLVGKDLEWAKDFLDENKITDDDILIGLVPGGGASWGVTSYRKQWPIHRFASLGNQISDRFHPKIILFGDANEVALCNQVASLMKETPLIVCGQTTLSRFAALLKRCKLVVCNDGGPLHITVSQGVRSISMFGPVDPLVYGPYPKSENNLVVKKALACQPCYKRFKLKECKHLDCLNTIEVKEVMAEIDNFLGSEIGGA